MNITFFENEYKVVLITVDYFQRFEFPAGKRENFRISSWKMRENAEIFKIRNSLLFFIYDILYYVSLLINDL